MFRKTLIAVLAFLGLTTLALAQSSSSKTATWNEKWVTVIPNSGKTTRFYLAVGLLALAVSGVAGLLSWYAVAETHSMPWSLGYGAVAIFSVAVVAAPSVEATAMKLIENHFTRAHFFVFLGAWLCFTALTFWIAEHGIEQDSHCKLVILTTLGTILGPMTGAISRNCQICCLNFSLSLLPYSTAFLILGTLPLFIKFPFQRGAFVLRMVLWVVGLLGWFLGGIVSYAHALN